MKKKLLFIIVSVLLLAGSPVGAKEDPIKKSEATLGQKIGNYRLIDQDGNHIPFFTLVGKPVVLAFMYIDCPDMCVLINQSLADYMEKIDERLKGKFQILSVSINPEDDTPAKMKEYGESFTDSFENWYFTTTDERTLSLMVGDMGFTYTKTNMGMDHLNRITLISPEGTVAKHFYGTDFDTAEMSRDIEDLINGISIKSAFKAGLSKFAVFCSTFNQAENRYDVDFMLIVAILGNYILAIGTLIAIFWGNLRNLFSCLVSNRYREGIPHLE